MWILKKFLHGLRCGETGSSEIKIFSVITFIRMIKMLHINTLLEYFIAKFYFWYYNLILKVKTVKL
jgi:hypothetical protein